MLRFRSALTLCALVLVLATAAPAAALGPLEFNLLAGIDFDGKLKGDVDIDTSTGYSLGLELIFDFPLIDVGAGIEYGFDRSLDIVDGADLNYSNVYLVGRVTLFAFLYVVGRYGYGELDGLDNLDGGQTWALGAGLALLDKIRLEVLFNQASAEIDRVSVDYESYSARLVYSF